MQVPGFLVAVLVLGGLLWTSYFHALWYGSRLEIIGGYSCTDQVIHYGEFEIPELCSDREPATPPNQTEDQEQSPPAASGSEEAPEPTPEPGPGPESEESVAPSTLERLAPAIAECFAVILCGYLAGRMGLIRPDEVSGLNKFVGNFVLPALIFLSLANLNFGNVNWGFLAIIYCAKALVFVMVVLVTAVASYPTNLGRAGLYGIFCTQSNDFALGYPLVQALYAKSHPDFASYLYLAAPSSLMMLNPLGFVLMELQRAHSASKVAASWLETGQRVLTGIGTNPVVFMTFLGILANGVFDHCLPNILEGILKVLGQAFSASALFMLGIQMVGKVKSMKGSTLLVPMILISIKCFLLPLIIRGLLVHFPPPGENKRDFQEYGFLVGTFPTAPGVYVFASLYSIDVDMLSSALVACTFLAMPFMLLSARMASIGEVNVDAYVASLRNFVLYMTTVGACTLACVVLVLLVTRKYRRVPYQTTLHLLLAQLLAAVGALLWYTLDDSVPWQLYLKYATFTLGQFAGRVWAALLAVTLTLVSRYTVGVVQRLRTASLLIGWGIPALLTIGVFTGAEYEGFETSNYTSGTNFSVVPVYVKTNPNMGFGVAQIHTNFAVQFICLIVVVTNLMLHHRYKHEYVTYVSLEETEAACPDGEPASRAALPEGRSVMASVAESVVSGSTDAGSAYSRSRRPSEASQASTTTSLGTSVAGGSGVCTESDPGVGPTAAGAAGAAIAPARRPLPRPLLKTRSQLQVEQAYLDEAQRKISTPELTGEREPPATRSRSVPAKIPARKVSAREQLTLSFSVKSNTADSNWKIDDLGGPPSAPAEVKALSFSVKKMKKHHNSELTGGGVLQCDATGCQLRKKISAAVISPDDDAASSVFGAGVHNEDAMSVASGETDLSAFSSVSHTTSASFAVRPPSTACSLYNPDTSALDADALRLGSHSLPTETSSVIRDRDEEFHTLRHTLLLVSLAWSMVVSMFLCGCSLPVQREGRMGGVYIQLTFIDTVINFGQGILAFFVLGLDPEAFLMPLRKRWMSLRYGISCLARRRRLKSAASEQHTDLVCQKFIDFYLEQCKQEIVRDRRVRQNIYHDAFLGTELVDWLLQQGLAGSRRAAVRYGRHLLNGGIIEHHEQQYSFHDRPFWYNLTSAFSEDSNLEAQAKISTCGTRSKTASTIVNVD